MALPDIFQPATVDKLTERINTLTPGSKPLRGKSECCPNAGAL